MGVLRYRPEKKKETWQTVPALSSEYLYTAISRRTGYKPKIVKEILAALADITVESLVERGQKVNIPRIGNFTLKEVPAGSSKIATWDTHMKPIFTINRSIADLLKLKAAFTHNGRDITVTADNWRDLLKTYVYTLEPGGVTKRYGFSARSMKKRFEQEEHEKQQQAAQSVANIETNPFL